MQATPARKCQRCGAPVTPLGNCSRADCSTNRPTRRPSSIKALKEQPTTEAGDSELTCPTCHKPIRPEFRYCPHCRAPRRGSATMAYQLIEEGCFKQPPVPVIEEREVAPPAQSGTRSIFDDTEADDIPTGTERH